MAEKQGARELVHAVLLLDKDADGETIVHQANVRLEPQQRVRGWSVWPETALPRTSGTGKLKRGEVAAWLSGNQKPNSEPTLGGNSIEDVIRKYTGGRELTADTSLDDLGLSSS